MMNENEKNSTNYNNPELNKKMILTIVKESIKPIDYLKIIECQELIKNILKNYIISDVSETPIKNIPKSTDWEDNVLYNKNKQPVKITSDGLKSIQRLNKSLQRLEEIYKKVKITKKNFHEKLDTEIATESTNIWKIMMDFIDNNLSDFIEQNDITDKNLNRITSQWVTDVKANLEKLLESSIKDYLHSLVNKSIILSKITNKNGWKETVSNLQIKDHRLIQNIEKEIKSDIKKITIHYEAPFIDRFSNELYTRCYKHLVSPIKKQKEPTTISELTGDMKSKSLKKHQWPIEIQEEFDMEYLEFLKTICNNKPNIKIYTKIKFKSLKSIAKSTVLSDIEKSELRSIYFKIYKLSRKYEKLLQVLEEKNKHNDQDKNNDNVKSICYNIEMSHHGFRPFLTSFIQQLQLSFQLSNRNLRKTNIKEYTESLQLLQKITETLELTRLLNQYFEKNPKNEALNKDDWLSKYLSSKKSILKKSIEPWKNHDWTEFLNHIIEVMNIKKQPESNNHMARENKSSTESNMSSMISKNPKIKDVKETSTLNNRI